MRRPRPLPNLYMVNSTGKSITGPLLAPVPLCSQGGFAPLNPRPIGGLESKTDSKGQLKPQPDLRPQPQSKTSTCLEVFDYF